IPSFTRSGRPSPSLRSRPPSGSASTTFRSRNEASLDPLSVMAAMLESRARRTGPRALPDSPDHAAVGVAPRDPAGISQGMQESAPIPLKPPRTRRRPAAPQPSPSANGGDPTATAPRKPKVKKLRLALVLLGLSALALISTVFGMMMAVANELPQLEANAQLRSAVNSTLFAATGEQIAK